MLPSEPFLGTFGLAVLLHLRLKAVQFQKTEPIMIMYHSSIFPIWSSVSSQLYFITIFFSLTLKPFCMNRIIKLWNSLLWKGPTNFRIFPGLPSSYLEKAPFHYFFPVQHTFISLRFFLFCSVGCLHFCFWGFFGGGGFLFVFGFFLW